MLKALVPILMFMCYVVLSYYVLCVFLFIFMFCCLLLLNYCVSSPILGIIMIFVVSFVNARTLLSHFYT
jgi:hypothetical protein